MKDSYIAKSGQFIEKIEALDGSLIDANAKVCAWTQFHFKSRVKSPMTVVVRYKTGCTGRSHSELYNFCPDCGGKPIKLIEEQESRNENI